MRIGSIAGSRLFAALLAGVVPGVALATNGYFVGGSSLQQMAMGGAGTAMVEDAGVAAMNPAGPAWTGTQLLFSFSLFEPQRSYEASGRGPGAGTGIMNVDPTDGAQRSVNRHFYIPGLTYNYRWDDDTSVGIAMYGNGGLNTKYNGGSSTFGQNLPLGLTGLPVGAVLPVFQTQCEGPFGGGAPLPGRTDTLGFCGNSDSHTIAGVDLIQMFIAPYYSRKITSRLSIGIEPLIAAQRFKASGFAAFRQFSNDPNYVTDRGYSYSFGGGVRVGVLWSVIPGIGVGASYQSRVFMTPFRKYAGLFADKGGFDIPSNFNLGIQIHPWEAHRFLFDFQRIFYNEIKSVGNGFDANSFTNDCAVPRLLAKLTGGLEGSAGPNPACLGAAGGPGFGWRAISIYKFGYQFQFRHLKLRAGYSFTKQPVGSNDVLFNIMAPGVIERHLTGGISYEISHAITLETAFVYAFGHSVYGQNPLSNAPGSIALGQNGTPVGLSFDARRDPADQTIRLYMRQFRAAVGFTYRFD